MEYSPPPLFKQGASARVKVVFFSLIALVLLIADARLRTMGTIRQLVGTGLYPLQVVALLPRDAIYMVGDYFSTLSSVQRENDKLKQEQVSNAQTLQQVQQLLAENTQLRKLLDASERLPVKSVLSEILYDARDAFTRKVIVDRGSRNGVQPGQPVIDDIGVVGQVTRVFPFTSEVTLLTDKEQAIPVQVVRTGLRSIVYGQGHSGSLDLRFMPATADIKNGDVLVTSGIDGIYPAGLAVAKVAQVESKSSDAFARIVCQPIAGVDRNRHLLILLTEQHLPPRPEPDNPKEKGKAGKRNGEAGKEQAPADAAKDAVKPAGQNATAVPAAPVATVPQNATTTTAPAKPASGNAQAAAPGNTNRPAPAQSAPVATPANRPAAPANVATSPNASTASASRAAPAAATPAPASRTAPAPVPNPQTNTDAPAQKATP
ncbi:rod shape-determining protein MreC [Noviherbaspirillum sp. CPCC 100848]|uniref:Cell shape-determining protein MreC n=1 Tax=Noviherbaspirillum album TaxID=3080276 RepID=A0ABU6J5Q1_9BURK|nr:rod shape-determining protein MreC [Noviherbaspirillum sp. CPCC 100848]MEC4718758.1 rod shape-determining protein MreC [Noviherbaspirillum sp. CPCC 100848]